MSYYQKILAKAIGADERNRATKLLEEYSNEGNIDYGKSLRRVIEFYKKFPKAFEDFKVAENKKRLYRVIGLSKEQTIKFLSSGKIAPKYELESWSTSLSFVKGWMNGDLCDTASTRGSFCFIIFSRNVPIKDRVVSFHEEGLGRREDDVLCKSINLTLKDIESVFGQRLHHSNSLFDTECHELDPEEVQKGLKRITVEELKQWVSS